MPEVLHVGPVDTPGGMASVIQILADSPPEGWGASTLATHKPSSVLSKVLAWRHAKRLLIRRLGDKGSRPDLVHVHTAADWSFRRKAQVLRICAQYGVPAILHIHSGRFDAWCEEKGGSNGLKVRKALERSGAKAVALSKEWAERLTPYLGEVSHIPNPVTTPNILEGRRTPGTLLLMGRLDPVKGARLAIEATRLLRKRGEEVTLNLTGVPSGHAWTRKGEEEGAVLAHGWLDDDELEVLRHSATVLLVPSEWEGQPMVVIEAMARGIPILASPACAEHLGRAGRVVEDMTAQGWAKAISELLSDKPARMKMSGAGRLKAEDHAIEVVAPQWKALYSEVLSS